MKHAAQPVASKVELSLQYPGLTVNVLRQVADYIRKQHGCSVEDDTIADSIAAQIEAQINPRPKPEVYAHLVLDAAEEIKRSVCGKVWRPSPDVRVLGKCPDCLDIINDEEWVA